MNQPTVSIYGAAYDSNNLGVRALCASLIQLAVEVGKSQDIKVLYGAKEKKSFAIQVDSKECRLCLVNFRLSPQSKYSDHLLVILATSLLHKVFGTVMKETWNKRVCKNIPWVQTILNTDYLLEINGGDSFSDIYGTKNYLLRIMPQAIAILLRKESILLPQTYGPFKSKWAKYLAIKLIQKSPSVFSRDFDSARYLKAQELNKQVIVCPDVAFILPSKHVADPNFENNTIGINISGLLFHGGYNGKNMFSVKDNYEQMIIGLIEFIIEKTEYNILLVPHVYEPGIESDPDAIKSIAGKVKDEFKNRVKIISEKYNEQEIKGIIQHTAFFIGARMHSCIAALSQCVPCIGMAYSKKFRGVYKTLEMEDCVFDLREKSSKDLQDFVKHNLEQMGKIKNKLSIVIPVIQKQIYRNFENIFQDGNIK